jgi:replication-associated recombination protein RarA
MTKKRLIISVVVTALGAALGTYVVNSLMDKNPEQSFDEILATVADQTNKTLPMMIDKETRLDATMAGAGKRFTYSYTLVNYAKGEIDTSYLRKSLEPTLFANYKSNPQMKQFRDEQVELHYRYKDKQGEFLLEIIVSPTAF